MRRRLLVLFILLGLLAGAAVYHLHATPAPQEDITRMAALGLVLLDDDDGVSVLAVRDRSPADRAGIRPGDLLLQANGTAFANVLQLEDLLRSARQHLQLQLMRDQERLMTVQLSLR